MKLVADSGGWTTGPIVAKPPAVAVLEVSGGVFAWTVDDPAGPAATRLTITDVVAAEWLWRVVGAPGHAAIIAALDGRADDGVLEVGVELGTTVVAPLRHLAVGHWLRRWWPESSVGGIPRLDHALLDGELAVLTSAADDFFGEDTLDSDVDGLLTPHRAALLARAGDGDGDSRIVDLVRACSILAEEAGIWSESEAFVAVDQQSVDRRDDYALAAGSDTTRTSGAIANGVGSVNWIAVPQGVFDAADGTVDWSVFEADGTVLVGVRATTTGRAGARGIRARLRCGAVTAEGVLDAHGTVAMTPLGADGRPLTETQAWDHDWSPTVVVVGSSEADSQDAVAAQTLRQRMRDFARARLAHPGPDAFLAEVLAAEADY